MEKGRITIALENLEKAIFEEMNEITEKHRKKYKKLASNSNYYRIPIKKDELTDSDLVEWIEAFFSEKGIKANMSIEISHDITEELANYMFMKMDEKIND